MSSSAATPPVQQPTYAHFISGTLSEAENQRVIEVLNPATGKAIAKVALADQKTLDDAVASANAAFPAWAATPIKKRVQVLYRFKALIEDQIESLARTVSEENGKTFDEAKAEIERGLEIVEFAASIPNMGLEKRLEVSSGVECRSELSPLGVVAGITPFNFPAMVPMWMFPVAIACGNAFVLKPSEQVPLSPLKLAELLTQAGLPDGIFNVVNGDKEIVEAITAHPDIKAVGFVGSSPVAKFVYHQSIANGKRALALGGAKNHLVVVPDADIDLTAANVVASATGCAGQRCMAASVLIAVGDCEPILQRIAQLASEIVPGRDIGPVISATARERINKYVTQAEIDGAKLLADGRKAKTEGDSSGFYVGASVIDNLKPGHPAACDEIFGPVLSILRVNTLEEAIAIENANPYGNAAAIYTTSGATASRFTAKASAGMVGVNIGVPVPRDPFPFGGWNDSRFGENDMTGEAGVRFWTQSKKITSKWSASASQNWMS